MFLGGYMPLNDRWYTHGENCQCEECQVERSKTNLDKMENPHNDPEVVDLDNLGNLKKVRKHHWWNRFFPNKTK